MGTEERRSAVDRLGSGATPDAAVVRTFLIADVRGYTRYTQERGDDEAARLAASFAQTAREVIEACDGELIELRGDEALSVFASARQAIRGAVELQRRFRSAEADFPLGIGIGLDSGEAVPVAGGFRGGALNLAARLCSIAGPGEILASETVTSLSRHVDGIRFTQRKPVRLKGFERPVRVVEVAPEAPLPPLPELPRPKTRAWTRVAFPALGLAVLAASLGAYAFLRPGEAEGLPGLKESTVGLVDPETNRIVAQVPVGDAPNSIAAGAGSVWITDELAGTVSRIDPETYDVHTIDVGGRPADLAFGAGSLWVVKGDDREVAQVDPESGRIVQTIGVGNGPRAVAVGFGAVWVVNNVDGTVSRIDLERGQETQVVPVGGGPVALAVSRDAVWVASEVSGVVSRLAARSGEVVATIRVGSAPSALAVGADAIWVANRQDATVSRIDAETNAVVAALPVGPGPIDVVAQDGSVWVAESGRGTLARIDEATGSVSDAVTLGASPRSLAFFGEGLWTTARAPVATHRGGTLEVISAPIDSIDPARSYSVEGWRLVTLAYDGLVGYRRVGGAAGSTLVPNLATHIPVPTDGGRTYTFQLRPGLRYSNGEPVRARDFRSSIERYFGVNQGALEYYAGIVGGAACRRHPSRCDLSRGIATDDAARSVTVHLTAPDPDFLYTLALPFASLVPADSPPTVAEKPLPGTGPYRIESVDGDRRFTIVRNPHFRVWAPDARPNGFPDEIVVRVDDDPRPALEAVEAGEADWTEAPRDRAARLATTRPSQLHSESLISTVFMFLNVRVPPFDDARVRRALNYAADRRRLVELLGGSLVAQPTCQLVPPNVLGYQPFCPYTVSPGPSGAWVAPHLSKAYRLIKESGTSGEEITVWTFPDFEPIGRYFATLLRQLGYETSLRVEPQGRFFPTVADSSARIQIGSVGWFADYPSASNFVGALFSCESFRPGTSANLNWSGLCDPRVDAAIDSARRSQIADPGAGGEFWAAADRALTDSAAIVSFANLHTVSLVSERVGNFQYHPMWGTLFDQLWVR